MADGLYWSNRIRSYEVSIWTLQDRFLSILKWATMDCKGQIQEPEIVLRDDGTQEFSFSIPKYYQNGLSRIENPMWLHLENQPLEANMHKLKVVFNKGTEDEYVFEFLVVSVAHDHSNDNVDLNVKAEGLAFHELGKIGYKIALSETNYTLALEEWERDGLIAEQPLNNIQFWNDLVFKDSSGNWRTNWTYELQMDWSAFSTLYTSELKRNDVLYEDEYISSWQLDENNKLLPREVQATREKCRIIDVSASNIYNITQTIAEQFGVFCRYEYVHDENYQIVGRKVIYYNNYIQDMNGHIDLTYPYSSTSITRTVDNSNVITKMFVSGVDYNSGTVTIMDVDANKTKEDYLLNFDYLHDIQGITEEQYEAIVKFEADIHQLNESLIQIQERIRVIQNQLTQAEADATTYRNASSLDAERWEAAGKLRTELTGGTNLIPFSGKPCTVMYKEECGYYINITLDGIDRDTLWIYQTSNYTGSDNAYSDPITSKRFVDNEFHNLVRIDNITAPKPINEGDTLWLSGFYNPVLAYDNIQKVWAARKINDDANAASAEKKVFDYNWYLHGRMVGYAQAGYSRIADNSGWPPAVVGPINTENNPFISDKVDMSRVVDRQISISELTYNFFDDLDSEFGTPDLLYYQDHYIRKKEEFISKFERMMGPALREGYWQPENYHDYGDLFKDDFAISYRDENIIQPKTSKLSFIWDGNKYYESEEPLIYTADAAGNVEQHLAIDLSDCLESVAANLDNLSFVYCNPSNIATLDEVKARQESPGENDDVDTLNSWIESLENSKYSSFRIGSGCELGWIAKNEGNGNIVRKPVLIVTGAKALDDDTVDFIVSNFYKTTFINSETERIEEVYVEASDNARSFIGVPVLDENGDTVLNQWTPIRLVGKESNIVIGATTETVQAKVVTAGQTTIEEKNKLVFNRKIPQADYDSTGHNRAPTPQEYTWVRQYPRLYFNTLKLKSTEIKLYYKINQLTEFEDYYTFADDRSIGLKILGVGYYTTIKPEVIFQTTEAASFSIVYTLSNIDVSIYLDALNVMYENSRPKVSYDVELSVLNPEFVHTAYRRLNQIVHINDNDLRLEDVSGYISTVTMKLDKPWEDKVEIKNYETKFEDLFSTIVAQTEAMKSSRPALNTAIAAFTSTGIIEKDVIYDSINSANLNLSFNSGKLTIDQVEGIWGTSDTGVVAFRGGGIFTATEKDNSGNWVWNTGILPSGINADLITTGQLDTNKIKVYAGNELRFQWNGEGLYAYKSFSSDLAEISNVAMNIPKNKIDQKQYVKFNQDGLFLTSEAGAYYRAPIATQVDGSVVYAYDILPNTINRVEISWKGLTLRNWKNEDVFFADPDTGDLTLRGCVKAESGTIGGWTITEEMLSGSGVNLVGTDRSNNTAGIYLTNGGVDAGESIIINGERCYHYKYTDENNTEQDCYCPLFNIATASRILSGEEKIYTQQYAVISAVPKYLDIVQNTTQGTTDPNVSNGEDNFVSQSEGFVNNITTKMYIVKTQGSAIHIKNSNNQDIEYDGTTSPNAQWYEDITSVDAQNYTTYIDENKAMAYVQVHLPAGTEIRAVTDFKITFSARANDGSVFIRKGQVGNYVINTTDSGTISILSNSQLDLDNYFVVDDKQVELGQIFYDITANSNAGTFSLYRLNGATENFNVAAMQAYKDAVAAAGKVTLTLEYRDHQVTALAQSGLGVQASQTITVSDNTVTVNNSSTCNGCTSNCSQACGGNCKGGCTGSCSNACARGCAAGCTGSCASSCGGDCEMECLDTCYWGCDTGCGGGCKNKCEGGCKDNCEGGCKGGCTSTCANSCRTGCQLTAKSSAISPN